VNAPTRRWCVALVVALAATACAPSRHLTRSVRPIATGPTMTVPNIPVKPTCAYNAGNEAITGALASASAIGWAGNGWGVVTCLGGTFYVQYPVNKAFGFGIYAGGPTTWVDADGYLPAQITSFHRGDATVVITEFADAVELARKRYVVVYARVAITNPTQHAIVAGPQPSRGLVALNRAPTQIAPGTSSVHDYAIAADRFGNSYAWPAPADLIHAGSLDEHYAHMRAFWADQLSQIAEVQTPDAQLNDAYRSGFIYTQIARSGTHLNTGVNNYASEFSHDVIGILTNLFTQGYEDNAHALLLEARNVVGAPGQYEDGYWTYPWPWAIYLLKTGDLAFVRANFATAGAAGASQPSIEQTAHRIAADRTGPNGIIGRTDDIDTNGYWTVDDYEALTGLAAYRYLAHRVGDANETRWASTEYDSLLNAVNATLISTMRRYHLAYLPCSLLAPNTANRCRNPMDANWAAPFLFGRWAWDGRLLGATIDGPGAQLIDATYNYGFARLTRVLPAGTYGGYPRDYYSTAYNSGYGSWALASRDHRDQGIRGYEFMVEHTQSGPYSWWESNSVPATRSPWVGSHPSAGQGSSPHAWGIANANKVLLDSIVVQTVDRQLIVGRGIPNAWLADNTAIVVSKFPTFDAHRLTLTITAHGAAVKLAIDGLPAGEPVLFEMPAFVDNIKKSTSGTIDQANGIVSLTSGQPSVMVYLRHPVV
jgi:hypothetical protein